MTKKFNALPLILSENQKEIKHTAFNIKLNAKEIHFSDLSIKLKQNRN